MRRVELERRNRLGTMKNRLKRKTEQMASQTLQQRHSDHLASQGRGISELAESRRGGNFRVSRKERISWLLKPYYNKVDLIT